MQRMWRQLFAALAGVLAVVGTASAQAPGSIPIPQPLPTGTAHVQSIVSPAQVAGAPIAPAGGQVYVRGSGGCNGCGSAVQNGCYDKGCNNGCGSLKSDCGFIFGSCKSFFNPCGVQPSGCGGGWGGAHGHLLGGKGACGNGGCGGGCGGGFLGHHGNGPRCGVFPLGTPYSHGCNPCVYDSFLNH